MKNKTLGIISIIALVIAAVAGAVDYGPGAGGDGGISTPSNTVLDSIAIWDSTDGTTISDSGVTIGDDGFLDVTDGGITIDRIGTPFILFKRNGTDVGQIRSNASDTIDITGPTGTITQFSVNTLTGTTITKVLEAITNTPVAIPPLIIQSTGAGGGISQFTVGTGLPTHTGLAGSLFHYNNQTGPGAIYVNSSVISGTTWSLLTSAAASTLLGLSDTPPSFLGAAGKLVKVNDSESAVEYSNVTLSADGNDITIPGQISVSDGIISPAGSGPAAGVNLPIRAGPGGDTGNGAALDLFGGAGGGTEGDGGPVNISAGLATFKGAGGDVIISATSALGGAFSAPGGDVLSIAGGGVGSGIGGTAQLGAGNGGLGGPGGPLNLFSGNGGTVGGGIAGPINITSGSTSAANFQAGVINITGGPASGFGGSGGPISLIGGDATHATNPGIGGGISLQGGARTILGTWADVTLQPIGGQVLVGGAASEHVSLHILADDELELPLLILENTIFNGGRAEFYTTSFPPTHSAKSGALFMENSEISAGGAYINTSVSSGTSWGRILTDDLATFGSISTGDASLTITADIDNNDETDNPQLLLSQDGDAVQGLLGITGQVDFEYNGALANTVFIEAKEAITANHVQIVTGSTVPGGVGSGTVRMTFRGEGPIGVGTNDPDASALMHFESTTQGIQPPSMTTVQQDAIVSPSLGLQLYNLSVLKPKYFNGTTYLPMDGMNANIIAIDSQTDWDALSSTDIITVSTSTTFLIRTTITTTKRINIVGAVNFSLLGSKMADVSIFYTGGGTFITGDGVVVLRIDGFNRIDGGGTGTFLSVQNSPVFIEVSSIGAFAWLDLGTITNCSQFRIPTAGLFFNSEGFKLNGVVRTFLKEIAIITSVSSSEPWFVFKNTPETQTIAATVSEDTITIQPDEVFLRFDPDIGKLSRIGVEGNILVGGVGELFDTTGTTGTFTNVSNKFIGPTTIGTVENSSGVARFVNFASEDVYVGQEVVISGYITNTAYNGTHIVTSQAGVPQFFEVASIPFGTNEAGGSFTRTSVEFVDAATTLVDGDTVVLDTTGSTFYDGGFTVYNKQINQFQVNSGFTGSLSGTWSTAGLDQTDPRILADNNSGFLNSKNIAAGFVNGNVTAHPAIVNGVFSDMAFGTGGVGLTESTNTERWKLIDPVVAIYEYIGEEPFDGVLTYDFTSVSSGGAEEFKFKWLKDTGSGFVNLPDNVESLVDIGSQSGSLSKSQPLTADKGDQIKPQVTRVAGTSGITTSYATINALNIAQ